MERYETHHSTAVAGAGPSRYEPVVRNGVTWNPPRNAQGVTETARSEPVAARSMENVPSDAAPDAARTLPQRTSFFALFCKPWSRWWKWTLAASASASALLLFVGGDVASRSLVFLGTIFGALAIPATLTVLFAEWDVTRRATLPVVARAALAGVVAAAAISLTYIALGINGVSLSMAAVVEEPMKGAAVLLLAAHARNPRCILSGLAVGCAVGSGFAALETVEYAYRYGEAARPSLDILLLRGMLSPFMHAAWTAALGGAIWAAQGVNGGWRRIFVSPAVYLVFAGMALCHAAWNTTFLWTLLGVVSWLVLLAYVQKGVRQAFDFNLVSREFGR